MTRSVREASWLALALLLPLGVYVRTLYPGLGGGGDAAKFQFLGRVLGTAHPPGYPLYVVVSHVFGLLPIGSLAYRVNLMSAVAGSLAAGLMYLACRGLGVRSVAAASAALSLAFGRIFWSKAVGAEVYALGALLVAFTLLAIVWWEQRRTPAFLLLAVVGASLAFGNHLTSVAAIPAYVAFVLLTDPRQALRPRVLAAAAAITVLGAAQYGFIILRTRQGAAYLESVARNLAELWQVVTARRFSDDVLAFSWRQLLFERVPEQARLIGAELGLAGIVFLGIGLIALSGARRRVAVLFIAGAAGLWALALNVAADSGGFLVPMLVFLCPVVAIGMDTACTMAGRIGGRRLVPAAVVLALASPVWLAAGNFQANDHSRRYFETWYMQGVFERLPAKSLIVSEGYAVDQLFNYMLLGEDAARGRDIRLVPPDLMIVQPMITEGVSLYAFASGRQILEQAGFRFEPVQLPGPALGEWLAALRPGWTVVVAGAAGALRRLPAESARALRSLADAGPAGARPDEAFALVGTAGHPDGAWRQAPGGVEIVVPPGYRIGSSVVTLPGRLKAAASAQDAVIDLGGSVIAAAPGGIALAVLAHGTVLDAQAVLPGNGFRVPINMAALPLFESRRGATCLPVGNNGWQRVVSVLTGEQLVIRVDNYRPFRSTAIGYLVGGSQLQPTLRSVEGQGIPEVALRLFDLSSAADRAALRASMATDGAPIPGALPTSGRAARLGVAIDDGGDFASITFELGATVSDAFAKVQVDRDNPRRALACGAQSGSP